LIHRFRKPWTLLAWITLLLNLPWVESVQAQSPPTVRLEPRHRWRPPFGCGRVGHAQELIVESRERPAARVYNLTEHDGTKELRRHQIFWPSTPPFSLRFDPGADTEELRLVCRSEPQGPDAELARVRIQGPEIEAEAVATATPLVNPVDLGAILVPSDWLLLGPGQEGHVEIAALRRSHELADASIKIWFESSPDQAASAPCPLEKGKVIRRHIPIPGRKPFGDRDRLRVSLLDAGERELWHKSIPVMLVAKPPSWPKFGATYAKLRYDAPISVRDPATGSFSSMKYEDGWSRDLRDVVVSLPDGSRFVFWRGASYIPFWAGAHNTGACYEWAEMLSRPEDAVDCVEPLMDKELRYGRVEILESTPACVRVRWTYQSTDLKYQVWGDSAVEEYTFYPDGFGVRTLDLKASPGARYELSEFIILTPPATYPLDVLPETLVDAIGRDGKKSTFRFPFEPKQAEDPRQKIVPPAIYRLRTHKDETRSAIYLNPLETKVPPLVFGPFRDRGQIVTPCYWGSHWPLARGNATGSAIDDRVALTPCHNSVMSWADAAPTPLLSSRSPGLDALGRSRTMELRRWAWLIGMSDASDARLIQWAQSFATAPSIEVEGGSVATDYYVPERRSLRLRAVDRSLVIRLTPRPVCLNPVLEIEEAPEGPLEVTLDSRRLDPGKFAWDGRRLWLDATFERTARLDLVFGRVPTR